MLRSLVVVTLVAGCHADAAPSSPRTDADVGETIVCPKPLGTAKPRSDKPPKLALDDVLRLNQLQAKATHNSYHLRNDGGPIDWKYGHAPLTEQLQNEGVRGVELDTHWNDACGRYEVYHLTMFDEGTTCRVFTDCLQALRDWSDAHVGHHPLFVHLEPKDGVTVDDAEQKFQALEHEILSVFPRELVITPDEVRGSSPTLRDAVTTTGWPTLAKTRGRVLFYLDRSDSYRDLYAHGRKDLNGRLLFADGDETKDGFAAVLIRNDALTAPIAELVKKGFVVRTFADKSIADSWKGDRTQLDAALASGAQIVSTDFPVKTADAPTYWVEIPGGTPSRCNPLTAPAECTSEAVEHL